MDYDRKLRYDVSLAECDGETKGFIWFHLLTVTELAIFSVRAPRLFVFSLPSFYLMGSVGITLVAGGLIACLVKTFGLHGDNLGLILIFNLGSFIIVDILKIQFRKMIGEEPGDIIASDELIEPTARTDAQKNVDKGLRYNVHKECVLPEEDRYPIVEVKARDSFQGFFDLKTDLDINGGFVNKRGGLAGSLAHHPVQPGPRVRRARQVSSPY